ncbi:MAG: NUDIX domain-containing protein [Pseudonocardia sp.]|nr:NUDIX domain-containing protein [Pseudonocardia sp.]
MNYHPTDPSLQDLNRDMPILVAALVGIGSIPGLAGFAASGAAVVAACRRWYRAAGVRPHQLARLERDQASATRAVRACRDSRTEHHAVARRQYFHDPHAPAAEDFLPVAYAIVRNRWHEVLLVRRADDGNWEIPGGRIEIGESAGEAAMREVAEEAGVTITITALAGVYTDPRHVLVYPGEKVHQQLAICLHACALDNDAARTSLRPDTDEISQARWFEQHTTTELPMHPTMRQRLTHALDRSAAAHFD